MARSRLVVTIDKASEDTFDTSNRKVLAHLGENLIDVEFKYRPAQGGMMEAKVSCIAKRGSDLRDSIASGRLGLVSIYRTNHKTVLPQSGGYVDTPSDFDTNQKSYLLFQGIAENPEVDTTSDVAEFRVRGLGKWLKDIEYTGTFTNQSVGQIFTTVMTEVIARSNQPIKAYALDDISLTGTTPDKYTPLHRIVTGEVEYTDASVEKILKDLQDFAGGKGVVAYGVRCRSNSDNLGEAYLEAWQGDSWTPEFQADESALEDACHVAKKRTTNYQWSVDTSGIKNSVTVVGAKSEDAQQNFEGKGEVGVSVKEFGRRHAVVIEDSLESNEACTDYAAAWLQENSVKKVNVELEWSDEQTLKDSRRAGAGTNAVPRDAVHFLRDMSHSVHLLDANIGEGSHVPDGTGSPYCGINEYPAAVELSKVSSGSVPHIIIDTSQAPHHNTSWSSTSVVGHPNKKLEYTNQYSTDRSMIYTIAYEILDPTAALAGRVICEWSKKFRLKIVQSGGAGADYGVTIETWRGSSTGWVDELTSTEEGASYGHAEVIPPATGTTDGGGMKVYLEIRANIAGYPQISLWSNQAYPYRTLLASVQSTGVSFAATTSHVAYADIGTQDEQYIRLGCGTTAGGTSADPATSGEWRFFGMRADEGLKNSSTGYFEYCGMNAEGIVSGSADSNKSFIAMTLLRFVPRMFQDGSRLLWLEPAINKSVTDSGGTASTRLYCKWTRTVKGTYDGYSSDGYHAQIMNPQSGDGVKYGTDATPSSVENITDDVGVRHIHWRFGSEGDRRRKLGSSIVILPYNVTFKYNGSHSPLTIKVKGGTVADALTTSTEMFEARLEEAERTSTENL